MSSSVITPLAHPWPADLVEFAANHQVTHLTAELQQVLERLFPTAISMSVSLELDPEIHDDWHIVFEVRVPRADVPEYGAAKRRWHEEMFRVCPVQHNCLFCLGLVRVP